ncbi:hypothetical protein B0H13DRAFT_1622614 [Mycena leptocephala]|nr:hypothetical protein B0H13DRAFT_1622614 [Mycena leptocephala]
MLSSSVDTEKPERSRNAKAQARHRAKRKATSKRRLEETVTKLQTALGQFTFEQVVVQPPPLAEIRELEARLMRENYGLHCMLSDTTAGPRSQLLPFDVVPRTRNCDDDR